MREFALCLLIAVILVNMCQGDFTKKVSYYEVLHISDIGRRTRRSADPNPAAHLHQFWFTAFKRNFHLILKQSNIIPRNFKAKTVNNNVKREFSICNSCFLHGHLSDDEKSHVEAHWEETLLSASITTADDTYILEPSWRFLDSVKNHSMIAYRYSDVKFDLDQHIAGYRLRFCGSDDDVIANPDEIPPNNNYTDFKHVRLKRQKDNLGSKKVCRLFVIADYEFYKNVGGMNKNTTATYMIGILDRVNEIYTRTKWTDKSSEISGLGFEIAELEIHENYTYSGIHYNNPGRKWNTTYLLQVFSRGTAFKDFCLAHLFTYHRFSRGVLGLAYIAGKENTQPGGICSTGPAPGRVFRSQGYETTFNTGWSSAQNSEGDRVLSLEASLVIAHELGHNWGSEHDPDTDSCAPDGKKGGKYLMYPYSVSGYEPNNQIFSPCSKRYIYNVITAKGPHCFSERSSSHMCGNGRIEGDEECDAGFNGDHCCSEDCKLKNNATCSPMNHECCDNSCQTASNKTVCHALPDSLISCKDVSKCNGINFTCPVAGNKKDNSSCVDGGLCKKGVCLNYCEIRGKYPCICSRDSGFACHRCCKLYPNDTLCVPEPSKDILPDGRPCFQGVCVKGVCEKQTNHIVQRLFSIIDQITVDEFVEFMKRNIVGTILVFSLLLWIPASCTFSYFDKKRERRIKQNMKWKSRSNYTLLLDYLEDDKKVKHIGNVKLKRVGGSVIRHFDVRPGQNNTYLMQSNLTKEALSPDAEEMMESEV